MGSACRGCCDLEWLACCHHLKPAVVPPPGWSPGTLTRVQTECGLSILSWLPYSGFLPPFAIGWSPSHANSVLQAQPITGFLHVHLDLPKGNPSVTVGRSFGAWRTACTLNISVKHRIDEPTWQDPTAESSKHADVACAVTRTKLQALWYTGSKPLLLLSD